MALRHDRPTPRADAAAFRAMGIDGEGNPSYAEFDAVEADFARTLERENSALREFAQRVMRSWPECDVDGGELQEIAVECGLLQPVEMTGPCGENCSCAELTDFPTTCLLHTKLLTGES